MALLTRTALALTLLALGAGLSGCLQADSRGDEAPDEVHVAAPLWDAGVRELMALKCAVCHQVPHKAIAPNDTPTDFDLRYHDTSPSGLDGASSITDDIVDGLLRADNPGKPKMPPPFATPLTTAERDALEDWAIGGGH